MLGRGIWLAVLQDVWRFLTQTKAATQAGFLLVNALLEGILTSWSIEHAGTNIWTDQQWSYGLLSTFFKAYISILVGLWGFLSCGLQPLIGWWTNYFSFIVFCNKLPIQNVNVYAFFSYFLQILQHCPGFTDPLQLSSSNIRINLWILTSHQSCPENPLTVYI